MINKVKTFAFWFVYLTLTLYCFLSLLLGYVLAAFTGVTGTGEVIHQSWTLYAEIFLTTCTLPTMTIIGNVFNINGFTENTYVYFCVGVFFALCIIWVIMTLLGFTKRKNNDTQRTIKD